MGSYDFISQYSMPFSLSLSLMTLLLNIGLIVFIRYRAKRITKKTLEPYYYALIYVIVRNLDASLRCYLSQRDLDIGVDRNPDLYVSNNTDALEVAIRIINCFSKIFFLYFITNIIMANIITYEFIIYQNGYRIEELDIAKQRFNHLERKIEKISKTKLFIVAVVLLATDVCYSILFTFFKTKYFGIAYSFLLTISYLMLTRLYGRFSWKMFMAMKKHHFITYKSHACRGLTLIFLTILSMALTLCKHLFFISWRICIDDETRICYSL